MNTRFIAAIFASIFALTACTPPTEVPIARPELGVPNTSNGGESYNKNAKGCLTEAIYFEARGSGYKGMRAVGEVLLNRAASSKFPNSICGVKNQRYNGSCQFSYVCDGVPEVYREPAQKAMAAKIADELLNNRGADITKGATFFHSISMRKGWFATLRPHGQFGRQLFYS